jgi:hypothetical protein
MKKLMSYRLSLILGILIIVAIIGVVMYRNFLEYGYKS